MRLRVITATRGQSPHLAAAVVSVAQLPGAAVHHVLVCPLADCARLGREFPACQVLAEEGAGLYAALNTGLKAAGTDEFFTWLNDDDLLVPNGFAAALRQLADDPELGAVYGRVEMIDGAGKLLGELPVAHRPADLPALLASGTMPLAQPGTVFRTTATESVGVFDSTYRLAGDLDFFVRAVRAGVRFAYHHGKVAQFRVHAGQLSKNETAAALEHARAIEALSHLAAGGARWRFRWDNRGVYWRRIRQHGFVDMKTLYRHG